MHLPWHGIAMRAARPAIGFLIDEFDAVPHQIGFPVPAWLRRLPLREHRWCIAARRHSAGDRRRLDYVATRNPALARHATLRLKLGSETTPDRWCLHGLLPVRAACDDCEM